MKKSVQYRSFFIDIICEKGTEKFLICFNGFEFKTILEAINYIDDWYAERK